ncbi:MAG TPA: tetratricopeptide repeat protein [Pyrinomonadaceae bacterium]|nr:tetratricopeptide repeat protein [Pyrinomonadaceae bacterium]
MKLLVLIICILFTSQTMSESGTLQPPRKGLVALHWPDLTKLEESVREQVATLQTSLVAAVKDPAAPDLSEAYGKLGQIYHAYSLTSSARECYVNASALAPKEFRWIYLLAKLDQQEGRFEEAIRRYQVARTLRPDYVAVPVNMGNIFLDLNRLDDAAASFNAALAIDKDNPATHYGLGQVAMSRRNYAEAVKHFEKTLAHLPGATRVHYSLAMAYRGLGNVEKVKAHLAQQGTVGVRVADPLVDGLQELVEGERLFLSRGKLAFEAQRYADAVVEFRKAVAARPDSVTARVNLGAALTQIGDLSGAVEQFEEAIRIEPGNANAHYNLAVLLARQGKHEQAIVHVRSALSIDSGDLSARYLLAQELLKVERLDEALEEFSHVVQADPNNESALLEQVKLLYRKARFKEALDAAEKGHAQYPHKGRTVVMLAYLLAASPALELRNGARAVELAQTVYKATRELGHGVLVATALAEAGRCSEAAHLQRGLIADAAKRSRTDLVVKLKADLKQYELQPCRPAGDASLSELNSIL